MPMQIRPGRAVDRATAADGAYARGVADGRAQAIADVLRTVTPALVMLETRTDDDGRELIAEARRLIAEVTP